jgi:hypothetical protein
MIPAAERLEVTDVVQHGTGRGSRIDLTLVLAGRRVRLTGLLATHVLSYGRIEKSAIEQGVVLPCFRSANRVWRTVLAPAMEQVRIEPSLEGEEIAEAIAAEIRSWLDGCHRGDNALDLIAGKVIEQGGRLVVSPRALVRAVRSRLVDDVLAQATIAEAAAAELGMRQSRPRFADGGPRPRAWTFPLPLPAVRSSWTVEAFGDPSMEGRDGGRFEAPMGTERWELDRLGGVTNDASLDPVHGSQTLGVISPLDSEMGAGSNGPRENHLEVRSIGDVERVELSGAKS